MVSKIDVTALRRSVVLGGLPQSDLDELAAVMTRRTYRAGEIVFHQGDPGHTLYLVCAGHLRVVAPSETGMEPVLNVLGPGDVFGELALLDGEMRSATVVAQDPVEAAVLNRADFLKLLQRNPAVLDGFLKGLARTVRRLSDQVSDLMVLDQQGHLAKKLLELAKLHGQTTQNGIEIQMPLTHEELATMVGAT